jgi:exodeoxyribonuclease V gamma subunit
VDLALPGRRLLGQIGDRWAAGVLRYRSGSTRPSDLVGRWVEHLALCADPDDAHPAETFLVGRAATGDALPSVHRFQPVVPAEAYDMLCDLVELWDVGQREPLLFFAKSSLAYARARRDGADEARAVARARQEWDGGLFPEGAEDHLQRLFAGRDPLGPGFSPFETAPPATGSFTTVAHRILDPLLSHLEEP